MADDPIQGTFVPEPGDWARITPMARPRPTTPLPNPPAAILLPAAPAARSWPGVLLLTLGLVLGLIAGGVSGGATALLLMRNTAGGPAGAPPPVPGFPVNRQTASATTIYNQMAGAVVDISVTLNGTGRESGGESEGTGLIVDREGHILTNNHVVENSSELRIRLYDGTMINATVLGVAPQDDLALLKVDIPADKLVVAPLGSSAGLQPGQPVLALGSPFGLDHTLTAGIISAVNRDWTPENGRTMRGVIQTDAPINPGNSGGPLLDDAGQVIGINTAIESPVSGSVGIGFAIPIDRAKDLLPQLQAGGQVARPWLGIRGGEITASLARQLNLPVQKGILVTTVVDDSPASRAGLRGVDVNQDTSGAVGDIITAIDGHAVGGVPDLTGYLDGKKVGDTVTLTLLRDGTSQSVQVTLEAWRDTP